ncbi:hypothetical protein FVE85_1600 [Porphyridium purpureum]|uniref:Uncharacterized protein n=1 Tax=Porphyridium purpureum TaxID=35688 RepID=A0A5J4YVZ7_PORPP|nr:hypothetical protein FVE85_1600 [Porphyridium purpureum]|eukprot:POR7555..scf209_3
MSKLFVLGIVFVQLLLLAVAADVPALSILAGTDAPSTPKPPAYQKYGGVFGRNGKYLVLSINYGDWFTNATDGACEASRSLCTDPLTCQLTREVSLDELRAECPQIIPGGVSEKKQTVIVQTAAGGTGSTWQLRSLVFLLAHKRMNPFTFHAAKGSNLTRLKQEANNRMQPTVYKTHEFYRREFADVGDVFFTSFDLRHRNNQICAKTHPNAFPDKSCKCCFAAWHTKNVYAVRLAELMGAASSLGLDIESIDFDAVLDSVHAWYKGKYLKGVKWV